MALTGGLAGPGKQALLGMQIWEEQINKKGGLLGRPVKLIYYDDQTNASTVPGIYTKLIDVDKVDLILGPYATNMIAPGDAGRDPEGQDVDRAVRARGEQRVQLSEIFRDDPDGSEHQAVLHRRFLRGRGRRTSRRPWRWSPPTRNSRTTPAKARVTNAKKHNIKIVYDRKYPPATTDFTPIVRAIQAANPDAVVICSYPPDSVGMVRAVNEIGFKPKMIGGAMVGLQISAIKTQLGPLMNGWINYETWVPSKQALNPDVEAFLKEYQSRAKAAGVDPLGYYLGTWGYAYAELLGKAVEGAKSLNDDKIAEYLRTEHDPDHHGRHQVRQERRMGRVPA